ncbi:hypothetical protein [Pyxidicoccus trucidator]|uniref:hypothetical protein n=1 Tax=Pyxidicoccus trucidator TaxID=2709662 RepID=UPI0013D91159|nr:hypothetical protein [Pyxidicoccus trucidator]
MAPVPGQPALAPTPVTAEAEQPPLVQQLADGVHYHFPVEINVVQRVGTVDVNAISELVMEKLARQLEQLVRERTGR